MENIELLDNILLSDSVCELFHYEYETNKFFNEWINKTISEIKDCYNNPQNNPWHIYNILDHILYSVEEMNKLTKDLSFNDRRLLAYTMLLHDIGKPKCKFQRMKDGKIIDSFFKHNIESSKIAKRVLPNLNFSNEEIECMCELIYKHDIFINITLNKDDKHKRILSEKLVLNELDKVESGDKYKVLSYLIKVGKADNNAQNPKMTKEKIELLNKMEEMLCLIKHRR